MSKPFVRFDNVTFQYNGATEPLFTNLSVHFSNGWSGIIGANGSGKSTLLLLATSLLGPDSGHIESPDHKIYCPQRTDNPPKLLEEFMNDFSKTASLLKDQLHIQYDWLYRWETLSHGERKRAQIGTALWQQPDVLAIDEPFNHLDLEARLIIANALKCFNGTGLLVSHERSIMDDLCSQSLFLDPPDAILRPGGYSKAMETIQIERDSIAKQRLVERKELKRLKKEFIRRNEIALESKKRVSKKGLTKKDHDARSKRDLARLTGKDAVGGRLKKQMESRLDNAQETMDSLKIKKEYAMGIWFPDAISKRNFLFSIPGNSLPLGENREIEFPELQMKPTDRIAITGPNGSGKSTLISFIIQNLTLPEDRVTYVPQEIHATSARKLLQEVKRLPNEELGFLMTAISCLGSRPKRLLASDIPSPGETRKLMLALGLTRKPHLIIMDEPTNHMDLPSIQCLENALSQCPCGLLLVSHDQHFLHSLTTSHWDLKFSSDGYTMVDEK